MIYALLPTWLLAAMARTRPVGLFQSGRCWLNVHWATILHETHTWQTYETCPERTSVATLAGQQVVWKLVLRFQGWMLTKNLSGETLLATSGTHRQERRGHGHLDIIAGPPNHQYLPPTVRATPRFLGVPRLLAHLCSHCRTAGEVFNSMHRKQGAAVGEAAHSATVSQITNDRRHGSCLQATMLLCSQGEKHKTLLWRLRLPNSI